MFQLFIGWIDDKRRMTGNYFQRPDLKQSDLKNIFRKLFEGLSSTAEFVFLVTLVAFL